MTPSALEAIDSLIADVAARRDYAARQWDAVTEETDPHGRVRARWDGARNALDVTLWEMRANRDRIKLGKWRASDISESSA